MGQATWISGRSGGWTVAADWTLATPPLATDDVTLTGSDPGYAMVSGSGTAAGLTLIANVALAGTFAATALQIGTPALPGALDLAGGATLAAASARLYGPLLATSANTKLTVTGALTLGGVSGAAETLIVSGGAAVRAGSLVLAAAAAGNLVTVDGASSLEIGALGGAAAGRITVDAGASIAGAGSLSAVGGIVDQGSITALGGLLSLYAPVTGGGQLQIGAGARLALASYGTQTTVPVSFTGAGGTLQLMGYAGVGAGSGMRLNLAGPISGFAPGDLIAYSGPLTLTGVTYQAGALTLMSGATAIGTLSLAGNYAGDTFQVTPESRGGADIGLAPASPAYALSPGTTAPDSYAWAASAGGAWGAAANWTDLTAFAGAPPIAPGSNDQVTIRGPDAGAYQLVTGPGNAASLTLLGQTALSGAFTVGTLQVGAAAAAGALSLSAGSVLAATSVTLLDGPLQAIGPATRLTVNGTLTLAASQDPAALSALAGAAIQAGSLVLADSGAIDSVLVDGQSTMTIGTGAGTTPGRLTIEAGRTLSGFGYVQAVNWIIDQGVITARNGKLVLDSPVSGAGQLQIGAGATLALTSLALGSTTPVSFAGPAGTLEITTLSTGGLTESGIVSGFVQGDTISYSGAVPLVSVAYQPGAAGTGTLTFNGPGGPIGWLTLAGGFTGLRFQLAPGAGGLTDITLVPAGLGSGPASPGTATPDAYAWLPATGGAWSNAANWQDVSTDAAPAAIAPGSNDAVTLAGPAGAAQIVTGPGNAASLTLLGNTTLVGVFNTGALQVGTATAAAGLNLAAGTTLNAGSAALLGGPLQASGAGTKLTVAGRLTLGAALTSANTLSVSAGAAVQAGSIVLAPGDSIAVDSASVVEIGAGTPNMGTLAVDAGATLAGAGSLAAANGILDQGTITAQGGKLSISSPVAGSGLLQIGAGATLALTGYGATAAPVSFAGAGGTLLVSSYPQLGGTALNLSGTITGFAAGDVIAYAGAATPISALYQAGAGGLGTLTLNGTAGAIGSLTLAGDYTGASFQLTPGTAGASNVTLVPPPATGVAVTTDSYRWAAATGGSWAAASNWADVTAGANPAAAAPGSTNPVAITGSASATPAQITGPGSAASLTTSGNVMLAGGFSTGALQVGTAAPGALNLAAGASLTAASAVVGSGQLAASAAGSRLAVSGTLTAGAPLIAANGGTIRAGSLVLGGSVSVDAASVLEVGAAGGAAAGRLTVDPGATVSGLGQISAASGIVDAGTILAAGGTLTLASPVTGGGTLQIGAGATLALTGAAPSSTGVAFTGGGATLQVRDLGGTLTEQGLISGFVPGETITYAGAAPIDGATYQAGPAGRGTLTLTRGGTAAGTLALAGDLSGLRFVVTPTADGGSVTVTPGGDFTWAGSTGGAWANPALWRDAAYAVAAAAPGADDLVTVTGPGGSAYQVLNGPGRAARLTLLGNTTLSGAFGVGSLAVGGTAAAQVVAGAGSQLLASGGASIGSPGGAASVLAASAGGRIAADALTLDAAGTVRADTASLLQVGAGAPLGTGVRVQSGAVLTAHGGRIEGEIANAGTIANDGALTLAGNLTGAGTLSLTAGVTEVQGSMGGQTVALSGADTVLRLHGLYGASSLSAMRFGETIDLASITGASITGATISGNTLSADQGTLALAPAPSGYEYKLYGDAHGGTNLLLHALAAPPAAVSFTDVTSGSSGDAGGDDYSGPVDYLQRQYIWSGPAHTLAIKANVPNAFLKGGAGDDALQVIAGNNVLDGGAGSNFLLGGSGADGGRDTFFVDARGGASTWSTLVHFHAGDLATIFGFGAASTRPFTAWDGVGDYAGVTIHSETAGPGTGVNASMTFTGIDLATAQQHFVFMQGTLPGNIGYLMIQYA